MKLYAGYTTHKYEYVIWARNYNHIASFLDWPLATAKKWFTEQKGNKALQALCPDKTKMYRSPMFTEESDWQVYREVK